MWKDKPNCPGTEFARCRYEPLKSNTYRLNRAQASSRHWAGGGILIPGCGGSQISLIRCLHHPARPPQSWDRPIVPITIEAVFSRACAYRGARLWISLTPGAGGEIPTEFETFHVASFARSDLAQPLNHTLELFRLWGRGIFQEESC